MYAFILSRKIFTKDRLFDQSQQGHDGDPQKDARQLPQGDGGMSVVLVQLRDQVRSGDVQKTTGRNGKDIDEQVADMRAKREDQ